MASTRQPHQRGHTQIEQVTMQQFARTLQRLMDEKRVNNSDVARHVWGTLTDSRGYEVARNRDRISQYLRGASYPEPHNLKKLAEFFGVEPSVLGPEVVQSQAERAKDASVALTAVSGQPGRAFLRVNALMTLATAAAVIALIEKDDVYQAVAA